MGENGAMKLRRPVRLKTWHMLPVLMATLFTVAPHGVAQAAPEPGPPVPVDLSPPSISGEAEVGSVLTASPGSWTESAALSYQWERCPPPYPQIELNCAVIDGASADIYTVEREDTDRRLRVKVTASNAGGVGKPAESAPTELVGLNLRPTMSASAELHPQRLPHRTQGPASLRLGFTSAAENSSVIPQLGSLSFELSHNLGLHEAGLKSCSVRALYVRAAVARRRCAASLVGHGWVQSELLIHDEYTPVVGRLDAYYEAGSETIEPRILARVQTRGQTQVVYVLPFRIESEKGRFATRLTIPEMPHIHGIIIPGYSFPYGYGRISSLSLVLKRSFDFHGRRRSFVTASCPAPGESRHARFPLLRAELDYSENLYGDSPERLARTVATRCRSSA
jgi:hypothetical protein